MAYHQESFAYVDHAPPPNMHFHPALPPQFAPYVQQPPNMVYQQFPFTDYGEFMHPGMLMDEFDDSAEVSTRPRLTKEQVEVLESQFQAHPKPNSMVKKQLAIQTKLTLPRVANWFQNRRAKAKQQKKQEEYENQHTVDPSHAGWKSDALGTDGNEETTDRCPSSPVHGLSSRPGHQRTPSESQSPAQSDASVKANWFSLRRAIDAAKTVPIEQSQAPMPVAMPPPDMSQSILVHQPETPCKPLHMSVMGTPAEWPRDQSNGQTWPMSSPGMDTLGFDFGFDQHHSQNMHESAAQLDAQYVVPPPEWHTPYVADGPGPPPSYVDVVSPPLSSPAYHLSSRRGSGSEELAANFGTFALANTPPVPTPSVDGATDLASRRKRPRPAALTSASLRSRSHGAVSATSPSFRNGPPSGGQLRQVKSTGHGLNAHYGGIRKASMPQKSPLNISSFAEADALNSLMAQHMANSAASKTPTPSDHGLPTSTHDRHPMGFADLHQLQSMPSELVSHYQQLQSPPATPFQSEFLMQSAMALQQQQQQPPPSAQYATFAEYTPPYSAGPLTNSTCSWSDAPLQSPDLPNFATGTLMSSMGFSHHDPSLQQWVLLSDNLADHAMQKKTEFFITEFPGQKEEHASAAQHILHQKPKNYVFANTAPSDYDG